MNFQEEKKYIGDLSQLFNIKEYTLTDGFATGEKALDIETGAGLRFTIALSRCMDITHLSMRGVNFSFISPCGSVAPQFCSDQGTNFVRSFTGGFLTTCGLDTAGPPETIDGTNLAMHGRIHASPAEQFGWFIEEADGIPELTVRGKMRQAVLFGEHLSLQRQYKVRYNENKIYMRDTVINDAYRQQPHMILYHFNLGYPLLCEDCVISIPSTNITPRDARAETGLSSCLKVESPQENYQEMCFFHETVADDIGRTKIGIFNPKLNTGFHISYSADTLTELIQWKMMNQGEYVMGLEPANTRMMGREKEKAAGRLKMLEQGQKVIYDFEIDIM